ncbi:hypothetical protein [Maribacter sp. ACAM166]|uniref:hypothetical protein n=1 Tax=Maribacter sp. ACAM166 TaxID=2508996 RepID=UPI0010FD5DE1|nr:hypothetical protein [Maribacter sp. ACAM166]TLP80125.1 hypothetical protein ES765_09085 [Maribacter sp. ACAM166]
MKHLSCIVLLCFTFLSFGQVKIGNNINTIDGASILELDSQTKAFVPTRITNLQMKGMTPLKGALVYNIDYDCIFTFDGAAWKSLCNSGIVVTTAIAGPTNNEAGDIWIDDTFNQVSVWNGFAWVLINTNPKSGVGQPSPTTVTDPVAGDIYVDRTTGGMFAYNGTTWTENSISSVGAGLSISPSGNIELGGELTHPTVITTNATNTLAIEGLTEVTDNTIKLLAVDETTGELHTTLASSFMKREELIIIAVNGQQEFSTPLAFTDLKNIAVYRNGIKIDFTASGSNLIKLETNVICFESDEIRIVQFF